MNKQEQVMREYKHVFSKMSWLNKIKMENSLKEFKSSEVHCIEYIGSNMDVNVTKLAEAFFMTRGAMSKITKKLITKSIIESYQKPENKKEIYFRLTNRGQEVYKIHDELHKEFQERDRAVFDQVTDEQFDSMLSFLTKYSQHLDTEISKLDIDLKSESL